MEVNGKTAFWEAQERALAAQKPNLGSDSEAILSAIFHSLRSFDYPASSSWHLSPPRIQEYLLNPQNPKIPRNHGYSTAETLPGEQQGQRGQDSRETRYSSLSLRGQVTIWKTGNGSELTPEQRTSS